MKKHFLLNKLTLTTLTLAQALTLSLTLTFASVAKAGPWEGYGKTSPVGRYQSDPNAEINYSFGIRGTLLGYQDPDFYEAESIGNPLLNPDFNTYNIIVVINKKTDPIWGRAQTLRVYQRGVEQNEGLIYYWLISTGVRGFETPSGFFRAKTFSSRHWSDQYDAPMFNSVFFSGGKALHSSVDTEALQRLGRPFSHGCVHIEDNRAAELFHRIGHSGYGLIDQIDERTGTPVFDETGRPKQITGHRTLIIVN